MTVSHIEVEQPMTLFAAVSQSRSDDTFTYVVSNPFVWIGAVVLLVILPLAVYVNRRQLRTKELNDAREEIARHHDAAIAIVCSLDEQAIREDYLPRMEEYGFAGQQWLHDLLRCIDGMRRDRDWAHDHLQQAAGEAVVVDLSSFDMSEYERLYKGCLLADAYAKSAQSQAAKFDELCMQIDRALAAVDSRVSTLRSQLDAVDAIHSGLRADGLNVDSLMDQASSARRLLELVLPARSEYEALSLLDDAEKAANEAKEAADALLAKRATLNSALENLQSDLDGFTALFVVAEAAYNRLVATYFVDATSSVEGNTIEAIKRIRDAGLALQDARELRDQELWDAGIERTREGRALYNEARSLLCSIDQLDTELDRLRSSAASDVNSAANEVGVLRRHQEESTDTFTSRMELEIGAAEELVGLAREEMVGEHANFAVAVRHAFEAIGSLDHVFTSVLGEQANRDRASRHSAVALKIARWTVARATWFIEGHGDDVSDEARRDLNEARRQLRRATETDNFHTCRRAAELADTFANEAYLAAVDDAKNAAARMTSGDELVGSTDSSRPHSSSAPWGTYSAVSNQVVLAEGAG